MKREELTDRTDSLISEIGEPNSQSSQSPATKQAYQHERREIDWTEVESKYCRKLAAKEKLISRITDKLHEAFPERPYRTDNAVINFCARNGIKVKKNEISFCPAKIEGLQKIPRADWVEAEIALCRKLATQKKSPAYIADRLHKTFPNMPYRTAAAVEKFSSRNKIKLKHDTWTKAEAKLCLKLAAEKKLAPQIVERLHKTFPRKSRRTCGAVRGFCYRNGVKLEGGKSHLMPLILGTTKITVQQPKFPQNKIKKPHRKTSRDWKDSESELCKNMAALEQSASKIASAVHRTRNAVIGFCKRNGIKLDGKNKRDYGKSSTPPKPKTITTKPKPAVRTFPEVLSLFKGTGKKLLRDASDKDCNWPLEDANATEPVVCGEPVHKMKYCLQHFNLVYGPKKATVT